MTAKTELELDLQNLQELMDSGQICDLWGVHFWQVQDDHPIFCDLACHNLSMCLPASLKDIAERLPQWRQAVGGDELLELAYYGRGSDLDKLRGNPNWQVRCAVAFRKREKDLDILVKDHDVRVREAVAMQKIDKYLDTNRLE